MYIAAIIDWQSEYILGWKISNTIDTKLCIMVFENGIKPQNIRFHSKYILKVTKKNIEKNKKCVISKKTVIKN